MDFRSCHYGDDILAIYRVILENSAGQQQWLEFGDADLAEYHLQLNIDFIDIVADAAAVTGTVTRIFRGPGNLQDTKMTLNISCIGGDVDNDWPPDGMGRTI